MDVAVCTPAASSAVNFRLPNPAQPLLLSVSPSLLLPPYPPPFLFLPLPFSLSFCPGLLTAGLHKAQLPCAQHLGTACWSLSHSLTGNSLVPWTVELCALLDNSALRCDLLKPGWLYVLRLQKTSVSANGVRRGLFFKLIAAGRAVREKCRRNGHVCR